MDNRTLIESLDYYISFMNEDAVEREQRKKNQMKRLLVHTGVGAALGGAAMGLMQHRVNKLAKKGIELTVKDARRYTNAMNRQMAQQARQPLGSFFNSMDREIGRFNLGLKAQKAKDYQNAIKPVGRQAIKGALGGGLIGAGIANNKNKRENRLKLRQRNRGIK